MHFTLARAHSTHTYAHSTTETKKNNERKNRDDKPALFSFSRSSHLNLRFSWRVSVSIESIKYSSTGNVVYIFVDDCVCVCARKLLFFLCAAEFHESVSFFHSICNSWYNLKMPFHVNVFFFSEKTSMWLID